MDRRLRLGWRRRRINLSVPSRVLKKSASFVLGSSKSSTYRLRFSEVGSVGGVFPFAKIHCTGERPHEVRSVPPRLFASSLAAALLVERHILACRGWAGENSGFFEHPVTILISGLYERFHLRLLYKLSFSAACYYDNCPSIRETRLVKGRRGRARSKAPFPW